MARDSSPRQFEPTGEPIALNLDGISDEGLELILAYVMAISESAEKVRGAKTPEEVISNTAVRIIDPIIETARKTGKANAIMSFLAVPSDEKFAGDLLSTLLLSDLSDDDKADFEKNFEQRLGELHEALTVRFEYWLRELSMSKDNGDIEISHWVSDIVKLRSDGDANRLQGVKKGFLNSLRSTRAYVRKQVDIARSARKNARSAREIGIWYSRYALGPAFENAQDGFLFELARMCTVNDEALLEDCQRFANDMGFQFEKDDFEVSSVREAMRQFCRARTGYNVPGNYLLSILPVRELEASVRKR